MQDLFSFLAIFLDFSSETASMPAMNQAEIVRNYLSKIGKKGGKKMTPAKLAACKRNAKKPRK
jgi:hypothetical protein